MANVYFKFLLFTGIDLVGPLREYDGKKYIFTAICYFSKYVEVKPISSKSAEEIALFLYSLICRYGLFSSCQSDQGISIKQYSRLHLIHHALNS